MRTSRMCLSFALWGLVAARVFAVTPDAEVVSSAGHDPDAGAPAQLVVDGTGSTAGSDPCDADPIGNYFTVLTFPNRFRGDMIQVTAIAELRRFAMELDFLGGPITLTFWVLQEDPTDPPIGGFVPIYSVEQQAVGVGRSFYWSPELMPPVPMFPMTDYVIGVSWESTNVSYGRDSETYPRPFANGIVLGAVGVVGEPVSHVELSPFSGGAYSMKTCFLPRPGACCLPSTHQCLTLFEDECVIENAGFFQGDGTSCTGMTACTFGACCKLNGDCLDDYTPGACADIPGVWTQDTECVQVQCPVLAGACCLGDVCTDGLTEQTCVIDFQGSFRGTGSQCSTVDPVCGEGACCATQFGCFETDAMNCTGLGSFQGDGTLCLTLPDSCDGVCCAGPTHSTCVNARTPTECNEIPGGVFVGYPGGCTGTPCSGASNTGRCCIPNGTCAITTTAGCTAVFGTWTAGEACSDTACGGIGACCRDNGDCVILTAEGCAHASIDGTFMGANTTCADDICAGPQVGACCSIATGMCTNNVTSMACGSSGGVFQGNGTTCAGVNCPPPPMGACCFTATGECQVRTQTMCGTLGGMYSGNGTNCMPNQCPQPPTGACCYPTTGDCQIRTGMLCGQQGGNYQGDNSDCEEADCPLPAAACCLPSGSCTILTPLLCAGQQGVYQGPSSTCTPNNCPQPELGACCFSAAPCQVLTLAACTAAIGDFRGVGSDCDPDPCTVITIVGSNPPNNAIDARQSGNLMTNCADTPGITSIELTFDGPTAGLTTADFAITTLPAGMEPVLMSVTPAGNSATLTFAARIPLLKWTIVTHLDSGTSVRIGSLPADVDNNRSSNPQDILRIIDHLNGVQNYAIYQTDADRSGVANPSDILRVIDLLNGAGCYAPGYNNATLPP